MSSPASSDVAAVAEHSARSRFRHSVATSTRGLLLGAATGAWAGLLVGGVGGRAAMFVLRLTSPDFVRAIKSDDGFEIGVISTDTIFLLALTTIAGAIAGAIVVALRWAIPVAWRPWVWAAVGGTVGGSAILHGDGVDFRFLEPTELAIGMFIAIPVAGAALMAVWIERWDRWWFRDRRRTIVAALPLAVMIPLFVLPLIAAAIIVIVATAAQSSTIRVAAGRAGPRLGQVALAIVAALSSWALVNDITEIL